MESGYIVSPEKGKVMAGNINPSSDVAMIERIRRKNVNDSYAALMSLVPNLFPKVCVYIGKIKSHTLGF